MSLSDSRKILTLEILNYLLGITEGAVGHYMTGRRTPPLKNIKQIAAMLDTSVSELIEDDPYYLQSQTEREFIDLLRQVPEDQRETLLRIIKSLTEKPE